MLWEPIDSTAPPLYFVGRYHRELGEDDTEEAVLGEHDKRPSAGPHFDELMPHSFDSN